MLDLFKCSLISVNQSEQQVPGGYFIIVLEKQEHVSPPHYDLFFLKDLAWILLLQLQAARRQPITKRLSFKAHCSFTWHKNMFLSGYEQIINNNYKNILCHLSSVQLDFSLKWPKISDQSKTQKPEDCCHRWGQPSAVGRSSLLPVRFI